MSVEPATPGSVRDERSAALLGAALGVAFTVCFVTGVLSHLIQDPPGWFTWPSRPAGAYRVNQGVHVLTGLAAIPLLLAKVWVVHPKLFERPVVRSVAHGAERLALLPLVGGAALLLITGLGNVNIWRPWPFSFRDGHYAAAWLVMGALLVHVVAKGATTLRHLRPQRRPARERTGAPGGLDRRGFLTAMAGGVGPGRGPERRPDRCPAAGADGPRPPPHRRRTAGLPGEPDRRVRRPHGRGSRRLPTGGGRPGRGPAAVPHLRRAASPATA